MKTNLLFLAAIFLSGIALNSHAEDWQFWRGPTKNGHASSAAKPVLEWSETKNVKWKIEIPGRGHSTPIVIGDRIFLTTADEDAETQSVLCLSRKDGSQIWEKVVNTGNFPKKIHKKNTHATPSLSSPDGKTLFAVFHNASVQLAALNAENGDILWSEKTGEYRGKYQFGYAPSPLVHDGKVIVAADYDGGGSIAAFDQKSGDEIWRTRRGKGTSYSSPVVANVAGREQLLISGLDLVASFDPATGDELWSVAGTTSATCGTMVWNADTVFASGGYPGKETIAVKADGSKKVLWRNGEKSYEQSMLVVDGHVYALNDNGIALCWDAVTGEEKWKERLGGPVSASPIFAGGRIYATNEQGVTFVFEPNPDDFTPLAKNQLGAEGFATPVFVDDEIFIRTAVTRGSSRQEWLYCIGE